MALALVSTELRPSQECPSQVEDLESKVKHADVEGCRARQAVEGCQARQAVGDGAPGGSWSSARRQRVNLHNTELIFQATLSFRGTHQDTGATARGSPDSGSITVGTERTLGRCARGNSACFQHTVALRMLSILM